MLHFLFANLDLLTVLGLFALYAIFWRAKRRSMQKKHQVDPHVMAQSPKPVQRYFGFLEKAMPLGMVVILLAHSSWLPIFSGTTRQWGLDSWWNEALGLGIGLAGMLICRIAQIQLGASWRVGIDEKAAPGLVDTGIYRQIRNPTYTGLYLVCLGALIALPTWLLALWVLAFFIMMEFQVRLEEEYLESTYGPSYLAYRRRTKRYIPFLW